jgi:hypothetical protein
MYHPDSSKLVTKSRNNGFKNGDRKYRVTFQKIIFPSAPGSVPDFGLSLPPLSDSRGPLHEQHCQPHISSSSFFSQ